MAQAYELRVSADEVYEGKPPTWGVQYRDVSPTRTGDHV